MPVHFKGSSEYKTHYVPFQSIKSASFDPSPQQKAKAAGKGSEALGLTMEPQITRKKRSQGPPTTLSTDFNQYIETPSDDFALLGRNDKFSENVQYKAKSRSKSLPRDASPPKQQRLTKEGKENKAVPRLKSYEPPPVVDTSKFRQPVLQEVSTPLAPRKEKTEQVGIGKELKQTKTVLKGKERPSRKQEFQESKKSKDDNLNANKMDAVKKTTIKDKQIIESMNEFSQTNMDKGVAISAPEAPSQYALKYKAGVAPPRPRRRVSEYSKAFTWKDRVASSPLLAAEQIIYNSNPAVAPFKADFPKTSEYAAQFKGYKLVTPRDVKDDQSAAIPVTKKRSKVRRSKSMGALRTDKAPPAGSDALITPDNKRQTVESELQGTDLSERAPPIKHGQMRRQKSEYVSNFQSPLKFNVERGAWRGADPPHLKQTVEPEAESKSAGESDDGKPMLSNWFAEVLELRRKAQEYKKRANGTHFSREHLVQLMAQQNEFWDQVSTARSSTSTLSALSLESGMEARRRKKDDAVQTTMTISESIHQPNVNSLFQSITRPPVQPRNAHTCKSPTRKLPSRRSPTRQSISPVRGESPSRMTVFSPPVRGESPSRMTVFSPHADRSIDYMTRDASPVVIRHKREAARGKRGAHRLNNIHNVNDKETSTSPRQEKLQSNIDLDDLGYERFARTTEKEAPPPVITYMANKEKSKNEIQKLPIKDFELGTECEKEIRDQERNSNFTDTKSWKPKQGDEGPMTSSMEEYDTDGKRQMGSLTETKEDEQTKAPTSTEVQDIEGKENSNGKENIDGKDPRSAQEKAQEKDSKPVSPKVDKQTDIVQQKQGPKDDVSLLAHEGSDEEPGKPDTEVDIHVEALRRGNKRPSQRRQQAWEDEEDVGSELTPVSQISQDEGDGRIPTPQLKQSASAARRHHFDRTTPLVGGSLLSSPPRSDLKPRRSGKRQVRSNVSRSWCVPADTLADDGSTITSTQSYSPVAGQSIGKTYNVRHGTLSATPTFGSPSKDTHFLRDDEASTDRPLQTTFVDTPVKSIPVISDSSEIVSQARPSKPKKFDVGPTITEGVGQTYNKPISFGIDGGLLVPRTDPDEDVLSVSARSVASSCSLASEVYERAQKRTQEFWGKDGIASR